MAQNVPYNYTSSYWDILVTSSEGADWRFGHSVALDSIDVRGILGRVHLMDEVGVPLKHDGRHPQCIKYLLQSTNDNVQCAWREVGNVLAGWLSRRTSSPLHVWCTHGRHRSMAWAIVMAIMLQLLGFSVRVWTSDAKRLCRNSRCVCWSQKMQITCCPSRYSVNYIMVIDGVCIEAIDFLHEGTLDCLCTLHARDECESVVAHYNVEIAENLEVALEHAMPSDRERVHYNSNCI